MRLPSFGIRSRIYGGSAVLVALGIGIAGLSVSSMSSISDGIGLLSHYSDSNTRDLEVVRRLQTMRGMAQRYRISGDESALAAGKQLDMEALHLLDAAAADTFFADRKAAYAAIKAGLQEYELKQDQFAQIERAFFSDRARQFTNGDEFSAALTALRKAVRAFGNLELTAVVNEVEADGLLVRVANWRFLATNDPNGPATFNANVQKASLALDAFERWGVPENVQPLIAPVRTSLTAYSETFEKVSAESLAASDLYDDKMRPLFTKLVTALEELQSSAAHDADAVKESTKVATARSINLQIGIASLGCIVGALLAFLIGRAIVRPINGMIGAMTKLADGDTSVEIPSRAARDEIGAMAATVQVFKEGAISKLHLEAKAETNRRDAEMARDHAEAERAAVAAAQSFVVSSVASGLEALAEGNLTAQLDQAFATEYEQLRVNFNAAVMRLHGLVRGIVTNTRGLRSGSGEIAQAADDLSRRTEQQAASLEETASALEQITATVRRTAEGAKHAGEVVAKARTDAAQSGAVVRDTVAAMSEIEQSARKISQIIAVIDEIAFQTNLLALNAGVEAARAGDAGRGFAVVAQEVRALAQRSAGAAKEIKSLISTSTQQVGRGVELVGETGRALDRIVQQVGEISGVVVEIAHSAQEQATGLAEVNTAVNQMDQVTQQNAAMVEQSTAASHALEQETEELANLTSKFQLG